MKILLCSVGSRGDVQPFLVLGDYLSRQGHEVKVASAQIYKSLAANYQVDYTSFAGDYGALVNDEEMKKAIGKNPFTIRKKLKEKVFPIIESYLQTFYNLSKWADVILYHPKTLIDSFGKPIQHKLIKMYVVPVFTPTTEFTNPILQFLPIPRFLNRLSYKLANRMMGTVKTPIHNFKQKNKLPKSLAFLETPIIYGISPAFLNRPADYPKDHHFTGFWLQNNTGKTLDQKVVDFMAKDTKTLLITFGSMPYKSKIDINIFIKAILQRYELNILLVKAWGLKEFKSLKDDRVLAIERAPFDLLFPLADYVLHHGGAGTTATALQAGIPQFICPVLHPFGDQFFWGRQVAKKGVGVPPVPLKKLTVQNLLSRVQELMDESLSLNAQQLRKEIDREDGFSKALQIITAHTAKHQV